MTVVPSPTAAVAGAVLVRPAAGDGAGEPHLIPRVEAYAAAGRARQQQRVALPVTADSVCLVLTSGGVLSVSTMSRRRPPVGLTHWTAALHDPTSEPVAHEVWFGIRRRHRNAPKAAIWTVDLARLVEALPQDLATPGGLLGLRDRALLLGFAVALRRKQLSALDLEDLREAHGLMVQVRTSKTDQARHGTLVGVPYGQRLRLCPVRAVASWRTARAITPGKQPEQMRGPLFRPVTPHGRAGFPGRSAADARRSPAAVRLVVQRHCEQVGLDRNAYAAHSLRSGFATQAAANGAREPDVMRHGRWRSVTDARGHVQRGSPFTDYAAGRLEL